MTGYHNLYFRSAAELFLKSHSIKNYFKREGMHNSREHVYFSHSVIKSLVAIENSMMLSIIQYQTDVKTGNVILASSSLKNLRTELAKFSEYFSKIHEVLVYLPRPSVLPEVNYCLQKSFGNIYDIFKPSIILGSVFNVLTYNFFQKIKDRIPNIKDLIPSDPNDIFIELPICDHTSPLFWSILSHELGHSIDKKLNISEPITNKIIKTPDLFEYESYKKWCGEITGDIVSVKALGYAPIVALSFLDFCFIPRIPQIYKTEVHKSHPPTRWRLRVLEDLFGDLGCNSLIKKIRNYFDDAFQYELELLDDTGLKNKFLEQEKDVYNKLIEKPAQDIYSKLDSLEFPGYIICQQSIDRLLLRLKDNLPVGAQGLEKNILLKSLEEYEKDVNNIEDANTIIDKFQNITSDFKEEPTDLASIQISGLIRREDIIDFHLNLENPLSNTEMIIALCTEIDKLNDLIISSIRSVSVHNNLKLKMVNL